MTVRENELLADALLEDRDALVKYISQGAALDASLVKANTDLHQAVELMKLARSMVAEQLALIDQYKALPDRWAHEESRAEALSPDGRIGGATTWHQCARDIQDVDREETIQ